MARPSTPILTEARILTAVRKLGAEGDFTLAQLASELGVRVSSIYHHVPSKSAIVHLLRIHWIEELRTELAETKGSERLLRIVHSYANFASAVPALIPMLVSVPLKENELTWLYEDLAVTLGEIGVPAERIVPVISAIDGIVLGTAFDLLAPAFEDDELSAELHPRLNAAVAAQPPSAQRRNNVHTLLAPMLDGLLRGSVGEPHASEHL